MIIPKTNIISHFKSYLVLFFILFGLLATGCSEDEILNDDFAQEEKPDEEEEPIDEEEEETDDDLAIYIPDDFGDMNLNDNSSTWSYQRSKESEHFIVFWGAGYGNNDPGSNAVPQDYQVNIDDLLEKAELFYQININDLGFAEVDASQSKLNQYKMMIFLFHQDEWLATGAGYDNTIGALWISPQTSQPVGATIAHEIGHSFQYQVHSDLGNGSGFRYGFGGNGGNAFWEQTANWQAYQAYPEETFDNNNFNVYTENYFRHIHHENYRYASYFIHYYWTEKHGLDFIGKLWREAQQPEDPIEAYMRITGITVSQFNNEIYDSATKFVTWDFDALRTYGKDYIGAQKFGYRTLEDGSHQVSYEFTPGTTGYNVIRLNVPEAGTEISTIFTGMANANGYNPVDESRAGWRYGYVALLEDGTRVYGDMNEGVNNTANFSVPQNTSKLWFVVTGAPNSYEPHPWDEDNSNDDHWPYKVKFENTNIYGIVDLPADGTPENITLTYDVSFPASSTAYSGKTVELETTRLSEAFLLQPSEIQDLMDDSVKFYAVESDGSLNPTTTANGHGHWFDANGNVISWGDHAVLFSEFDLSSFSFSIGQFPAHAQSGEIHTIKQAFVYEYEPGQTVQATIVFNIELE